MRIRSVSVVDVARRTTVGDQVVEWDGDRITAVGPDDGTPPAAGDVDGRGLFALPGLIDCHVHVTSLSADEWADSGHRASYVAAHAVRTLGETVRRGFTTVRDAGGADAGLTRALDEGVLTGPRLHTCGKALSQTSGHADLRPRGRELWDPHPDVPGIGRVVDGPDAVRLAVREQVRRGATFIKLMLSGGITSPTDRLDGVQFSDAEVTAAVEEADRLGVYCAGHAYTGTAVSRAVALGVRTIEHGNLIGPADAERMAARGAFLVPTRCAPPRRPASGSRWAPTCSARWPTSRTGSSRCARRCSPAGRCSRARRSPAPSCSARPAGSVCSPPGRPPTCCCAARTPARTYGCSPTRSRRWRSSSPGGGSCGTTADPRAGGCRTRGQGVGRGRAWHSPLTVPWAPGTRLGA